MYARVNERQTEYLVEQTRFPHPHVADDDIFKDELEHVGKRSCAVALRLRSENGDGVEVRLNRFPVVEVVEVVGGPRRSVAVCSDVFSRPLQRADDERRARCEAI
jgi:hypothetical protein